MLKNLLWNAYVQGKSSYLTAKAAPSKYVNSQNDRIVIFHQVHNLRNFEKIVLFLHQNYNIVPLTELSQNSNSLKSRISLTFDDGFQSVYLNAFPILKSLNLQAEIFICPGFIKAEKSNDFIKNNFKSTLADKSLSIKEIKILLENGWTLGNHTFNHFDYSKKVVDIDEVILANDWIKSTFGLKEIPHFAIPFGGIVHCNPILLRNLIEKNIFKLILTGINGRVYPGNKVVNRTYLNENWNIKIIKQIMSGYFDKN